MMMSERAENKREQQMQVDNKKTESEDLALRRYVGRDE